jgi:hypothetical protein
MKLEPFVGYKYLSHILYIEKLCLQGAAWF